MDPSIHPLNSPLSNRKAPAAPGRARPTSSKATPRPPPRSKPSSPRPWPPPAATPRPPPGRWCPGSATSLLSNHSVKAYGRDLADFVRHMQAQGVDPLHVTADHVKLYKRALLEAGLKPATVARRLSVLRGTYKQLAAKGLVSWETAQDIAAIKAPGVQKNSTPSLTQRQAIALLEAIPADTLQGHARPGADERVLPDRLPGLGGRPAPASATWRPTASSITSTSPRSGTRNGARSCSTRRGRCSPTSRRPASATTRKARSSAR